MVTLELHKIKSFVAYAGILMNHEYNDKNSDGTFKTLRKHLNMANV